MKESGAYSEIVGGIIQFPSDLRIWLQSRDRVCLVLEKAISIEWPEQLNVFRFSFEQFNSRGLIALLAFSYSVGIFLSSDIKISASDDPDLRYLCGKNVPGAPLLGRFRRLTHEYLSQMLGRTLICCSCGDDVGVFEQHWNRDAGYGICRPCLDSTA